MSHRDPLEYWPNYVIVLDEGSMTMQIFKKRNEKQRTELIERAGQHVKGNAQLILPDDFDGLVNAVGHALEKMREFVPPEVDPAFIRDQLTRH